VIGEIKQSCDATTRLFSFGICTSVYLSVTLFPFVSHFPTFICSGVGSAVDSYLVRGMAAAGRGAAEFTLEGEAMEAKVMRQLQRALCPELCNVRLRSGRVMCVSDAGSGSIVGVGCASRQLLDLAWAPAQCVSERHDLGVLAVQVTAEFRCCCASISLSRLD
jgi:hypothetical protein